MSATDEQPSRLEQAKQRALALVDQMSSGDVAMVISFADTAQTQSFTESRRSLRRQIEAIAPDQSVAPTFARRCARPPGLANPGLTRLARQSGRQRIAAGHAVHPQRRRVSPRCRSSRWETSTPVFLPVGQPATNNLAIVAFATDRNPQQPERMQAFVSVANFGMRVGHGRRWSCCWTMQSLDLVELTVGGRRREPAGTSICPIWKKAS